MKIQAKGINRNNIYEHLLEKQFNLIDMTIQDALLERDWMNKWVVKKEKYEEFEKYALALIKKVFKCNKSKAEKTLNFFKVNHGIKIE